MIRKSFLAVFLVAASISGFACNFGPPGTPTPLTSSQIAQVLNCQSVIKAAGHDFVETKLTNLEICLDEVLKVQLLFENGITNQGQFNSQIATVRKDCFKKYQIIGRASTTMINTIVTACSPVESIILPSSGYDPLEFGVLSELADATLGEAFTDVTELAGAICGGKEEAVDWMVFEEVPRMGNLLDVLNGNTYGEGPFGYIVGLGYDEIPIEVPAIYLDDRCNEDLLVFP